ncbi:coiled-coil domain-containing protein 66 [Cheilinus undulatus]|uniref:coiled-coil domain-containing protein 66 n=1 Tax=Cheilinus undulatus TaxID=241271 RepID=UPI001BD54243|nr:coiled-coil domain-containing protein 66 [Cheilinus undulatus]
MNLGDGLLFELENGKPKLILLSHGIEKNPAKPSCRSRAGNILSSRQPSCVDEVQKEENPTARQQAGRHKESRSKIGGAAAPITSNTGKSTTGSNSRVLPKLKSDRHKNSTTTVALRANGKPGRPQSSGTQARGKKGQKDTPDTGLKEGLVCLTSEQLQKILSTVQNASIGQLQPEKSKIQENQTGSKSGSSSNEGGEGEMKEEDRGGEKAKEDVIGLTDIPGSSQDKNNRLPGCLFSWMDERVSESRAAAIDAKKAQWRRELAEQMALKQQKQQRSASSRLQVEEDTESLLSVQTSISYRDQPAAIRSSLRVGEVTPMEEVLSAERKEEQRRRWLEELDQQREQMNERRRREKLLQSQTEDHELWATHFDSLQRKPPLLHTAAPSAPPPAPSNSSDRGEWEPSSSLSLVWEAMSSCGAESVGGASMDITSGYQIRTSHLRTMTALLDPAQIEERERRRLKQLEQQRDIEAQMEERRLQREQEEARRREEEEAEEKRLAQDRERMERQYELDTQREKQKSNHQTKEPQRKPEEQKQQTQETSAVSRHAAVSEKEIHSSVSLHKDTAVQTEEAPPLSDPAATLQTPDASSHHQQPPSLSAAPPNNRSRAGKAGKENICVQAEKRGGGDLYQAFARTDRSRRDRRRPEWNTQRPSRRFVPASERYPASLQKHRQESRLKRQAELLALQERTCLSRTDPPPPPPPPPPPQDPHLLPNPTQSRTSPNRKVESLSHSLSAVVTDRGRSPPVPALRNRIQSQQASPSSSSSPPPHPPVLEFVPYVRTDEVFNLDPLEPADTPPPHSNTEAPPQSSASHSAPPHRDPLLHPELRRTHTHRQQEILEGLAKLRQGLLQKQRELETDFNPLLKRHDSELRTSSATHRM